jgi:hypothetical protein
MEHYVPPHLTELGSVRDLTHQSFNKVGNSPDNFTAVTNGIVIGSLVTPN